jgi:hypothetical protein
VLIGIGSVKGSPGVTTLAVVLAATWPGGSATVVEADCAGGDVGGRCWLPDSPGLASLATAARTGVSDLAEHAARLPCGVPVVVAPASRQAATIAVGLLAETDSRAWAGDRAVLVDLGRLDPGLPNTTLAQAAGVLLVVARGDEGSLLRLADAGLPADTTRLVLVGGCDYPDEEVTAGIGLPVAARLPWDRRAAEAVWAAQTPARGWTSRGLPAAARALAAALAGDSVVGAGATAATRHDDQAAAEPAPPAGPWDGRRAGSRT